MKGAGCLLRVGLGQFNEPPLLPRRFRLPAATCPGAVERERDAWVQAIDKLCSEWKRKSMGEHAFAVQPTLRNIRIEEEAEEPERTVSAPTGGLGGDHEAADDQVSPAPSSAAATGSDPAHPKRVPNPRTKTPAPDVAPEDSLAAPTPVLPTAPQPSPTLAVPLPPPPPPMPTKWSSSKEKRTKPFHWDVVAPDKVNSAALVTLRNVFVHHSNHNNKY